MLGCIGYATTGGRLNLQSGVHTQRVPGESAAKAAPKTALRYGYAYSGCGFGSGSKPSSAVAGQSEQAPTIIERGRHMQQRVRWAVVGTSDFALDWIARGIRMGGNSALAAVVSRDAERAEAAAQRVGAPHSYPSIEAIDPAEVDGVFLVLPNTQHAPYAIAAARRHLHVIGEKPMAPTLAECDQMIEAARASGVVLAVAHCMEWAPTVAKARELVASGAIGEVIS